MERVYVNKTTVSQEILLKILDIVQQKKMKSRGAIGVIIGLVCTYILIALFLYQYIISHVDRLFFTMLIFLMVAPFVWLFLRYPKFFGKKDAVIIGCGLDVQCITFEYHFTESMLEVHYLGERVVVPYLEITDFESTEGFYILNTSDRKYILDQNGFVKGGASTFLKFLCDQCPSFGIAKVNLLQSGVSPSSLEGHIKVYKKEINRILWVFYGPLLISIILYSPVGGFLNGIPDNLLQSSIQVLFAFPYGKKKLHIKNILSSQRKMQIKAFAQILICTTGGVFAWAGLLLLLNGLLSHFGLKNVNTPLFELPATWLEILYVGLLVPILEEVFYRGILISALKKYGKVFAIIISAFIFGMCYWDFSQIIVAVFLGVIYGYVALEYSVKWSILLHIYNNLILSIGYPVFLEQSNKMLQQAGGIILQLIFIVAGGILFYRNRHMIKKYRNEYGGVKGCYKYAFQSASIVILVVLFLIGVVSYFDPYFLYL